METKVIESEVEFVEAAPRHTVFDMGSFQTALTERVPEALAILGWDGMREGQKQAVYRLIGKQDCLCIMSTSGGKTGVYLIPTLAMGWKTVIFSPLLALMRDQVQSMQRAGLRAVAINSDSTKATNSENFRRWHRGDIDILLVAPEQSVKEEFMDAMQAVKPNMIAMDECMSGDTEVLTDQGFIRFDALDRSELVAQVCPDTRGISFVKPERWVEKAPTSEVCRLVGWDSRFYFTKKHDMLVHSTRLKGRPPRAQKVKLEDVKFTHDNHFYKSGVATGNDNELTPFERLVIAYQVDGNSSGGCFRFKLRKPRKMRRLTDLLTALDVTHYRRRHDVDGEGSDEFVFRVKGYKASEVSKDLSTHFDLKSLGLTKCREIIEELNHWDGHWVHGSSQPYLVTNTCESAANFYQTVAILADYGTSVTRVQDSRAENFSDVFRLGIHKDRNKYLAQTFRMEDVEQEPFDKVYCVTVPKGNIVIRRKGRVMVTGNCHTLTDWADNFRPAYKNVGRVIEELNPEVVLACSATCPGPQREEVRRVLGLHNAYLVKYTPPRSEIQMSSATEYPGDAKLAEFIVEETQGSVVVYCSSIQRVVDMCDAINAVRPELACTYHGKMTPTNKKFAFDAFMTNRTRVVVATCAFGMGIDKPDIRWVIHRDIPSSLEALAQEIGRAARDGNPARAVTYYSTQGRRTQEFLIRMSFPDEYAIRQVFHGMQKVADVDGLIHTPLGAIAEAVNVPINQIYAIMSILKGEGVVAKSSGEPVPIRIKFNRVSSLTKKQMEVREAIYDMGWDAPDDDDGEGWIMFPLKETAEELNIEPQLLKSRVKNMEKMGSCDLVITKDKQPTVIMKSIEEVPQDFWDAWAIKCDGALGKLGLVEEFCRLPDEQKADFLKQHLHD